MSGQHAAGIQRQRGWTGDPVRFAMTPAHGGRALIIAAATAVAGDHSITVAIITAGSGVAAVICAPLITELVRRRRKPAVDHHAEVIAEQKELVEHLLAELAELRGDNRDQENELRRLRRRRD